LDTGLESSYNESKMPFSFPANFLVSIQVEGLFFFLLKKSNVLSTIVLDIWWVNDYAHRLLIYALLPEVSDKALR
jgi:hypothetical protein